MDLALAGKRIVVTGGASNIGRAITLNFAVEGASVIIADIDTKQMEKVANGAKEAGAANVMTHRTDVTDIDDVRRMVERAEAELGGVDVLVNNVGWTHDRLFIEKPREEWEKEIQLNLWSAINCTRAVLDGMMARGSGAIVSIGSDAGRIGEFREAVYGATKAGVIALMKSCAREYGRYGIRFNVVCPGTTMPDAGEDVGSASMWGQDGFAAGWNTEEMRQKIAKAYPLRRVGTPDDIASAVAFLASGKASFITGQTLSVSGGYSMM